ncbi:type-2 ice-structuring protein-like [Micropterus dolomieu]|uniref:type-2 ice-structuring protein-like n=1 Tax=Micropterus dolomieu TaxID=147949 RepID=UPI001E8E012B|nr:type-2 ice-structuring protein-like [Micropterus dolomieu]
MKTLTLSALLCAMMALTRAAALPDTEDEPWTEESADYDTEEGSTDSCTPGKPYIVKTFPFCPRGWTAMNGRCFFYVARAMSWAVAERNCMSLGGHLASVHNIQEYRKIRAMISRATRNHGETWIGGSDGQQEGFWFWSDGSPFSFTPWCRGEPNNSVGRQHCLLMNYSGPTGASPPLFSCCHSPPPLPGGGHGSPLILQGACACTTQVVFGEERKVGQGRNVGETAWEQRTAGEHVS